jgi:hypothetical protein
MSDPAAAARLRQWRARHRARVREIRRAESRKRNRARMRNYDRTYRTRNRKARNLAQRCGVTIKVARMWLREGRVPSYRRPRWATR